MDLRAPIVLLGCAVLGAAQLSSAASRHSDLPQTDERAERTVVFLTNEQRAKYDLPPLKFQGNLRDAARWMVQDMSTRGAVQHTDGLGRRIESRIPDLGYRDSQVVGENIAGGQLSPSEVVTDWMQSPGHRANILNADYREIGVGYQANSATRFVFYWAQEFGCRSDVYPVVINNEAAETHSSNVRLYIYGKEWAKEMRLSNDGQTWSAWEPFKERREWTLDAGIGKRTVWVETRGFGPTQRNSDTIEVVPDRLAHVQTNSKIASSRP